MAISDRIEAEARRTIDGMQLFYKKYGNDLDDAEELEHRIARVEAAKEGCNGLTQEDKIQKTAENLFELTCAQERTYDALHRELKLNREEYKLEFDKMNTKNGEQFAELKKGLASVGKCLEGVMRKIEDSGMDSSKAMSVGAKSHNLFVKTISEHPILAFNAFIFILVLVFVSGHFDAFVKLCGK